MNKEKLNIYPIGVVKNSLKKSMPRPNDEISDEKYSEKLEQYFKKIENTISEIIIFQEYQEALEGIEDFSHLFILFWPHLISEDKRSTLCVHPMGRQDIPKKGVFATCSPIRPNPILLSTVTLIEKKKNILKVKGLDALDQSLVIDIKPYLSHYHFIEGTKCAEWLKKIVNR